jgi:glucokinase
MTLNAASPAVLPGALAEAGPWVAGLDLGGTKIAACVAAPSGVVARSRAPVPRTGDTGAVARAMIAELEECCTQLAIDPGQLAAIGVSACGPFVGARGALASAAPNLCGGLSETATLPNDWTQIDLEVPLRERFGHVVIANDAQAALVAEHRFGALRDSTDCAYLTWSTGIGVGLMLDSQLLRGKSGNAGHAGHSVVPSGASPLPQCGCGNEGDVESLAGGASLARRWGADTESLFAAWRAGDAHATALVDQALDAVADLIYNLVVTLDIERIAIGGGLFGAHEDRLLPALRARLAGSGRRSGMQSMLAPLTLAAVDDPRRTAELGALSLVIPADWNAFGAEPMALHS